MKKFNSVVIGAILILAGCAGPNDYFNEPVEKMSAEQVARLQSLPMFVSSSNYSSFCLFVRTKNETGMSKGTENFLTSELKRRGQMLGRDIEILTDREVDIETGMSLNGLRCAFGPTVRIINKSFYGRDHNWQVRLVDGLNYTFSFAYLEGDGTEQGMRVQSWN